MTAGDWWSMRSIRQGLDGIVEVAVVAVEKIHGKGPKCRKVLNDEKGQVRRVQKTGVLVDYGSDGPPGEVLVHRTPLVVLTPQKADIPLPKPKHEAAWRRRTLLR